MKRTSRVFAAVVAATALTITGVHAADAKPAHAGPHAKADKAAKAKSGHGAVAKDSATKLSRHVTRVLGQLDRAVSPKRLAKLDGEHVTVVEGNAGTDRVAIAEVLTKSELRAYRVENYRLAVNILRQAAMAGETTEAEALALDASVALALAITATSSKAQVREARAAFAEATELLEDDTDEAEEQEGEAGDGAVGAPTGEDLPMLSDPITELPWTSAV